jgi:uncharacterized protein YutE (UPF0331/DUF86 family)
MFRSDSADLPVSRSDSVRSASDLAADTSDPIVRDSAILRFTYCVDVSWKTAAVWLDRAVGERPKGPKPVLRACATSAIVSPEEAETLLRAVDDRNLAVHAYREALALELAARLSDYKVALDTLIARIRDHAHEGS